MLNSERSDEVVLLDIIICAITQCIVINFGT